MEEVWKDIEGYEGLYQVSNMGRIKSLPIKGYNGRNKRDEEYIMTPIKQKTGYYRVHLRRNRSSRCISIHRIVATHFLENPNNYKQVNHKNEDKADNRAENLEWCTARYNTNYGTGPKRRRNEFVKNHGRPVNRYDLDWNFIKRYDCVRAVLKDGFNPANVQSCCNKKKYYNQSGGCRWRYAERENNDKL